MRRRLQAESSSTLPQLPGGFRRPRNQTSTTATAACTTQCPSVRLLCFLGSTSHWCPGAARLGTTLQPSTSPTRLQEIQAWRLRKHAPTTATQSRSTRTRLHRRACPFQSTYVHSLTPQKRKHARTRPHTLMYTIRTRICARARTRTRTHAHAQAWSSLGVPASMRSKGLPFPTHRPKRMLTCGHAAYRIE